MALFITVLVSRGSRRFWLCPRISEPRCCLGNTKPCLQCNKPWNRKRRVFHTNAKSKVFTHERELKYLLHLCLPLPFFPGPHYIKAWVFWGNNWASLVAGCGRAPRLPPACPTLFRRWAALFIYLMKTHPSIVGGLPKQGGNCTRTPCTECRSDGSLHLFRKELVSLQTRVCVGCSVWACQGAEIQS